MKIYSRERWNAHYAHTERMAQQYRGAVNEVFLHFADMPGKSNTNFSKQCATMRAIQEYHMDDHGWSDIGYHYVVFQRWGLIPSARVFEGRRTRFVPSAQGGHNTNTIAVCVLKDNTEPFKYTTQRRVKVLLNYLKRDVVGHGFNVRPHCAVTNTDCPGLDIRAWIHTLPKPY